MSYTSGKQKFFYCRTPRMNTAYACAGQTPESDILDAISEGLQAQVRMAVNLRRLWEEQHQAQKKDAAAMAKLLTRQRESHHRLCQRINEMYESFALGEISKTEYLAAKAAAVRQRDAVAAHIAKLEVALEDIGQDGGLKNSFVSAFEKYAEVEEITGEIMSEILQEVSVYPGGRLEIVWNFRDEMEKLMLDLQ